MHSEFLQDGFDKQLAHVVEEAGEVMKEVGDLVAAAGKIQRWGPDSYNPLIPESERETNLDWLQRAMRATRIEVYDLLDTMERLGVTIDESTAR